MKIAIIATLLTLGSLPANAAWTNLTPVTKINIGPNGTYGTAIQLENTSFSGCSNTKTAVILPENNNYKELISILLTARISALKVQVKFGGCNNGYSVIQEVVM